MTTETLDDVDAILNGNGTVDEKPAKLVNKDSKKKNKKKKKKKKNRKNSESTTQDSENTASDKEDVEVEYVFANPLDEIDRSDPLYSDFASVFQKFQAKEETPREEIIPVPQEEAVSETTNENEDDQESTTPTVSKRKKKQEKRPRIAVLKQLVKRPDVVEAWDVTSADPFLLVHLKAYKNTVPVPRHWNQKRRYLQGKRGIEKGPFQLPDFIAATGITKIRQAIQAKEDNKKLKSKARERMNPKLGKMDIDYQVLHDAFFKYQTKPKLTGHGDLYYEGKEFEITLKEKRPGFISEDLKKGLGMPEGAPPPYLINMQRYGPPPSYPNLKIPGLNAPIPDGARFGYHPGGWGKPPVDEFGRPLYGDVFGTNPEPPPEISQPIEKKLWGEVEEAEEIEEEVQEEEPPVETEEPHPSGLETPSGIQTPSGMETPESLELRKVPRKEEEDDSGKQLFQVLEQKETQVGTALFGSAHKYVIPGEQPKQLKSGLNKVDLMKSQATEKLDIALEPTEIENMENLEGVLKSKYEAALAAKKEVRPDVSDVIEEHNQKKRKKDYKDKDSKKKHKEFKF